jgi:hypothetical protein
VAGPGAILSSGGIRPLTLGRGILGSPRANSAPHRDRLEPQRTTDGYEPVDKDVKTESSNRTFALDCFTFTAVVL